MATGHATDADRVLVEAAMLREPHDDEDDSG
jgi:hypothetical protein